MPSEAVKGRHRPARATKGHQGPSKAVIGRQRPPKAVKGQEAIKNLEKLGVIERVDPNEPNHWSSPIHFVWKSDGSLRPVGDYRLVNQATILDVYPLPELRAFADQIIGSKIFSRIDLTKAFHQILIDKRDRAKTAVNTQWGMYQFRRLSMGLQNSAQSFQRLVDAVLKDMPNLFVYLDDILF